MKDCSFCGNGPAPFVCDECADAGIDGPTRRERSRLRPRLTRLERVIAAGAGLDLDAAGRRALSRYIRGPWICRRFDALSPDVRDAARLFEQHWSAYRSAYGKENGR